MKITVISFRFKIRSLQYFVQSLCEWIRRSIIVLHVTSPYLPATLNE